MCRISFLIKGRDSVCLGLPLRHLRNSIRVLIKGRKYRYMTFKVGRKWKCEEENFIKSQTLSHFSLL